MSGTVSCSICVVAFTRGMNVHNKLRLNDVLTACSLLYLTSQYSFTHSHSSHSICFIFYSVMDKTLQSVSTPYMGPKGR